MTQHLWYVRKQGTVAGPFPAPQVCQFYRLGQVSSSDEVSLDAQYWVKLHESGILDAERIPKTVRESGPDDAWREEREKARMRWLNDAVETRAESGEEFTPDEVSSRMRRHEDETRVLLSAHTNRKPAILAGILTLLATVLVGIGVWYGQSGETGIQAGLTKKATQCGQAAGEGVSWAGCDKRDTALGNAVLRNANLNRTIFERADLARADLAYANLDSSNLRGANLRGAILRGASMARADLTGADLRDADLEYAILTGAILDGARLDGANMTRATLPDGRVCEGQSTWPCP